VPARRKFLRAERTEFGHIDELVKAIALARPQAEIRLSHNARPVRFLRPAVDEASLGTRVGEILGEDFPQHSLRIDYAAANMRLSGWIGCRPCRAARPTSNTSTSTADWCATV
jgi:DNA mismatch repair protein MutL